MSGGQCDCCDGQPMVGAAAVPGVPISVAYCKRCLQHGCWGPLGIAEANMVAAGLRRIEEAAEWFQEAKVFVEGEYRPLCEVFAGREFEPVEGPTD